MLINTELLQEVYIYHKHHPSPAFDDESKGLLTSSLTRWSQIGGHLADLFWSNSVPFFCDALACMSVGVRLCGVSESASVCVSICVLTVDHSPRLQLIFSHHQLRLWNGAIVCLLSVSPQSNIPPATNSTSHVNFIFGKSSSPWVPISTST